MHKLQGTAEVVVFCSVWGRHDVNVLHRRSFNRRLQQLADRSQSQHIFYHRMPKDLNSLIDNDGIHLDEDGQKCLEDCMRQVTRRALDLL